MKVLACIVLCIHFVSISSGAASINSLSNKLVSKHFSNDYMDTSVCLQDAACTPIQNATCFGTMLPYSFTSVALAEDSISQFEVQDKLALWHGLRSVPRCWAVIQPLLCAVYMPKCENGSVFLPSQEMCRITRGPCKSVEVKHNWPSFLQCENRKIFPPHCRNPLQEVKFNTTYKCIPPLIKTDNPDDWFNEVEGCGIQCQDPFFTEEEHKNTHQLILILAGICFGLTVYTTATYIITWEVANKYPGVIIFYINVCLATVSFGWLFQFLTGDRDGIVCTQDGAIRRQHPRTGNHLCHITFFLTYFSLMKSFVWFVYLTYEWYVLLWKSGTQKDVTKKRSWFRMFPWCIPSVQTVVVAAMHEVDGDSMSGICFVGYSNMTLRLVFLLIPNVLAAMAGIIFLACVLYKMIRFKSDEVGNIQMRKKFRETVFRIGIFSAFAVVSLICSFACLLYDFINRKEWNDSLREHIVCLAMNSYNPYSSTEELPNCQLKNKPSIAVVHLYLFNLFGFGIIMSLCVWSKASLKSWKLFFIKRFCESADKNTVALKKHQIISKCYEQQQEVNRRGRPVSFSLHSMYDDPVGMNLDANSVASQDISSSWVAALPQFLVRRNALPNIAPMAPKHYSSASDVSRHISVDSFNQQNFDSLSMQISEQEYVALRHQRRKTRKERERFLRANRIAPWFPGSRRSSDTSLQSSLMAASIAAAAKKTSVGAKVTKATSTGDLGAVPLYRSPMLPPMIIPPVNRPHIQRPAIDPPFTHGMTDNSHQLDGRVPSVASAVAGNSNQRFSPSQCSTVPYPFMGMVRAPVYGGSYDMLNSLPYGYLGTGMYPSVNGMYPGYPFNADYAYNPYGTLPYASYAAYNNQFQQNMLSVHMAVDSGSEKEMFPIVLSDSEYTDTGQRSYDESEWTTQRLQQIQLQMQQAQAQTAAAAASQTETTQPKPALEPQECAKTQFLKRMESFGIEANVMSQSPRAPSGRKSQHSEAPPPSPVESSKSLNEEDLDDVFDESSAKRNDLSLASLPHASETESILQKLKSKFRRATSFTHNLQKPETLELTPKTCHGSLGQLSKVSSCLEKSTSHKDVLKEKWLHASEGTSLMNGDAANENVSR